MKSFLPLILTLIAVIIGVLFYMANHFSLSSYFAIITIYLLLMTLLCKSKLQQSSPTHQIALLTYFGVAILSLMVFSNYYQAKGDIFYNTNHHALAWKGYQLPESGLLYGQDADAFLQDTATTGTIRYEIQKNDSGEVSRIHLIATNLNRSFFSGEKGEQDGSTTTYYNKNATLTAIGNDGIKFLNTIDSTQLKLEIIEIQNNPGLNILGGPERDSVLYIFSVIDNNDITLCSDTVHSALLIQKSYAVSDLMPVNAISLFGNKMEAFNIVREHYRTEEGPFTLSNYGWLKRMILKLSGKNNSFRDQRYFVEQVQDNKEVAIINSTSNLHHFETILMPGDPFFIGFGSNGTPRMYFSQKGQLLFDLPQWRPLSSEKNVTDMLVSSSDFVVCNPKDVSPYNILFSAPQVDKNDGEMGYPGNNNMFTTIISYSKGPTQEYMRLSIDNDQIVEAGQDFLIPCHSGNNAQAILQLTDFKTESAFQPKPFYKTILWIFLIATLSILLSVERVWKNGKIYSTVMPTITEMACIVLLMVLFTTRYIMCWRLAVFPPFEDVSRLEYVSFINNKVVHHWLTSYLIWALSLLPMAKFILLNWKYWKSVKSANDTNSSTHTSNPNGNKIWHTVLHVLNSRWLPALIAIVIEPIICMFLPRGAQILLPVSTYFLLDIYLTYHFIEERATNAEEIKNNLRYYLQFPFILNFVAHLLLLLVLDAGYGVMFLLFGIIRYYLSLARWALRNENMSRIWWFMVFGGMAAILCLFYFSATIVSEMMNSPILGNTIIIIAGALGILFIIWGIDESFNHKIFSKPINSFGVIIVSVVFSIVMVSTTHAYDYILGPDGHYTHLRYRTKVLVEDWKDILNHERVSNARNISRFRQTSENQWILDNYYENRPQEEDSYFHMQPMSKRGAMWGAQTTDLSFLRFGIGEHGMSFATGIILLMLVVCAIAMWQPKSPHLLRKEARQNIAIGALLLILMQAIFVWMSVTNKFIFFGQDFPMLSMTSKMTIFYVVFLLIFASLFSIPDPEELPKVFNNNEKKLSLIFTALLAFFCLFLHFYQGQDRKNKNQESYELELNGVKKVLHAHNALLHYYQLQSNNAYNDLILNAKGGRASEGYNPYGQKLFSDFNDNIYLNLDEEHEDIKSPDCVIDLGTEDNRSKFPLFTAGSELYQPLVDFYKMRRNKSSVRMVLNPDSVTLRLEFPQDSLYSPRDCSLIEKLNELFASYQIENRGLYLAQLYVGKGAYSKLKGKVDSLNNEVIKENHRRLNTNDFASLMTDYQAFLALARQNKGLPQNKQLDSLLAVIDNVDKIEGATFTNSLIEAYINNYSKDNNSSNIVYIRRDRDTGYLEFNINSHYFKIGVDEPLWRGDIVANDAEGNNILLMRSDGQNIPGDQQHYDHFDVARIPSSWLQGEKDQYLLKEYAPIRVQLKKYNPIELPYKKQWTALKLSNTDGAKIIETGNKVGVRLPDDLYHVFAKNVWINGKRRHIYPLGKELFWMKPYSDYVSSVMSDSIKAGNTEATVLSHTISLDYGLSDSLYQHVASIGELIYNTESNDQYKQANLSVFVGNSDGEILAMPEFNGDKFFRVNPNDHASIAKVQNRSTLFSDYTDERHLNGNQNLLPLSIGPGSSLKPLTFGAVSSTYDPGWINFRLVGSLQNLAVKRYAEKDFGDKERPFISYRNDEPRFGQTFDIARYLIRSSNYFNSAITFIGSFSEESLQKGIFTRASNNISQYGRDEFPVMSISGQYMKFDTVFNPRGIDAKPILMERFYDNYGVYSEPTIVDETYLDQWTLDPVLRASSKNLSYKKSSKRWMMPAEAWAIPEPSFIDFPLRANDKELSYAQKIKTITLGMRRVVSVTPLKMGEMYARMFLLDNHFRFTVSRPEQYQSHISYNVPAYDNQPINYLEMLQAENSLFQGMTGCALTGGTAGYMDQISRDLQSNGLHMYAKTGTIDNNNINQASLLAVVITNTDMQKVSIENGKMVTPTSQPLKFYVIYIAQDKTKGNSKSWANKKDFQKGVMRCVINSDRFKKFFGL